MLGQRREGFVAWPFEGRIDRIVDHVSDGIAVVDHDWRLVYLNGRGARILDSPVGTLIGRALWDALPGVAGTVFADVLRRAMDTQVPETVEAPYEPLGRWVDLRVFPAPQGLTVYFRDVTQRRTISEERTDLVARVTAALRRSEQLLDLTESLSRALTLDAVADIVTQYAREQFDCRFAGIALIERPRATMRFVSTAPLPDPVARKWGEFSLDDRLPATDAVRDGEPRVFAERGDVIRAYPHIAEDLEAAGTEAMANLPLVASDTAIGVMLVTWAHPRTVDDEEQRFLRTLANQSAQAIERARLFMRQQGVSVALQRAILPRELPSADGVDLAARYLPVEPGLEVGGDWYDAVALPDGRLGLMIGDVAGHGLDAAALMGQVRNAARAYAIDGLEPGELLTRLNRLVSHTAEDWLVTTQFVAYDPATGAMRWSNAGHPPPAVIDPLATSRLLEDVHGPPLGTEEATRYTQGQLDLGDAALLLYTDGLIEQRRRSIVDGLAALLDAAAAACLADLERFCRRVASSVVPRQEREDDMCMLVARRRRD